MTYALALTTLAGLATALGGLLATHPRLRSSDGLGSVLAFAAGAMLTVSALEILPKGAASLETTTGSIGSAWAATLALAVLAAVPVALASLLAARSISHDLRAGVVTGDRAGPRRLARGGAVVAVAVAVHNAPEGLVTLVTTLRDPGAGIVVAAAIALHNIPEGLAVASPFVGAGARRRRAVLVAGLAGAAEPVGAVVGYLLLVSVVPEGAFGIVFGLTAGVMTAVSVTELLPAALLSSRRPPVLAAALAGCAVMGVSLALLRTPWA